MFAWLAAIKKQHFSHLSKDWWRGTLIRYWETRVWLTLTETWAGPSAHYTGLRLLTRTCMNTHTWLVNVEADMNKSASNCSRRVDVRAQQRVKKKWTGGVCVWEEFWDGSCFGVWCPSFMVDELWASEALGVVDTAQQHGAFDVPDT